jgi:hypothetical protein
MESPSRPPDERTGFSSPLLLIIIVVIIVAGIALFLIFRPNPGG